MARKTGGVPTEILRERETRAWELRQRFYTHERIAKELLLERSTITKILGRLSDRANASLMQEISEEKIAQINQLHFVADEAIQAWYRSKEVRKGVSKKTSTRAGRNVFGKDARPDEEVTMNTQDQDGDPRYLDVAMKALAEIRKILGINAPEDIKLSGAIEMNPVEVHIFIPDNGRGDSGKA